MYKLKLNFNNLLQLQFSVTPGTGAIALAHFETTPGICPSSSMCDFESGTCNWTSTDPNFAFTLQLANGNDWGGAARALYDHTTETQFGHVMEAYNGI